MRSSVCRGIHYLPMNNRCNYSASLVSPFEKGGSRGILYHFYFKGAFTPSPAGRGERSEGGEAVGVRGYVDSPIEIELELFIRHP